MIRTAYTNPELRSRLLPIIARASTTSDLKWAAAEIDKALDNLGDVVQVLEARGSGPNESGSSLADDHSEVGSAVDDLRKFSQLLSAHVAKLKRLGR
jgi:hypothetical protein